MSYPQTGSNLYGAGGKNRTGTALSTNIIIKVGTTAIGAIQHITIDENRSIHQISELGTDGIVDSAPNSSTTYSVNCERIRFDRLRVAEAFGRGYIHVKSQRYPFDIEIIDTSKGDGNNSIVTTLRNCWIEKIGYSYKADNFIISESISFKVEDISSVFSGTQTPVAEGGERNVTRFIDAIERDTDSTKRRGALDAPGLITAFGGDAF